jgi:post-segregation antitoxin (ccd killing protein)
MVMMNGLSSSRSYGQGKPRLDGRDVGNVASNGSNFMKMPANVMTSECTQGIQSDLLEKIRASDINISCKITEVQLQKARATTLAIKPRGVGTDTECWTIGEKEIPCNTLEEAIIVGIEILNRG